MIKNLRRTAFVCLLWLAPPTLWAAASVPAALVTEANREEAKLNAGPDIVRDPEANEYLTALVRRLTDYDEQARAFGFRSYLMQSTTP